MPRQEALSFAGVMKALEGKILPPGEFEAIWKQAWDEFLNKPQTYQINATRLFMWSARFLEDRLASLLSPVSAA